MSKPQEVPQETIYADIEALQRGYEETQILDRKEGKA